MTTDRFITIAARDLRLATVVLPARHNERNR